MEIELRRILRAIRRFWWMPVVAGLILGTVGFAAPSFSAKNYRATTQVLVMPLQEGSASIAPEGNLTTTFQGLVTSGPVLDLVIRKLDLNMSREDLASIITVNPVSGTQILEITVIHKDPQVAADIVNSIAENSVVIVTELTSSDLRKSLDESRNQVATLRDQIAVIDSRLDELDVPENEEDTAAQAEILQLRNDRLLLAQTQVDLQATIRGLNSQFVQMSVPVTVVETASVPENPEQMSRVLLSIIGAFVGAIIGAAVMILSELLDKRLWDASDFSGLMQAPVQSLSLAESDSRNLSAARLRGLLPNLNDSVLVSPRTYAEFAELSGELGLSRELTMVNGLLDDSEAVALIKNRSRAVVAVKSGKDSVDDVEVTVESLRDMGVNVVGGVIIK